MSAQSTSKSTAKGGAEAAGAKEADALRLEGNEHFRQGRFNRAVLAYTQALELHVTPVLIANRAQAYLKMGSFERAVCDATEALRRDPRFAKALFRRAAALEQLGLFGRARADLERLLALDPANAEAAAMLGRVRDKVDVEMLDLTVFSKTEALQSTAPLRSVEIRERRPPSAAELERISLNQAARPEVDEVEQEKPVGTSDPKDEQEEEEEEELPPPPRSFMDFYTNVMEMTAEPKRFAAYFLSIPTADFDAVFGDSLEPQMIATIVRSLRAVDAPTPAALHSLFALSKVNRFDLCVLMAADEIREDLLAYLRRFGTENADEIVRIRGAYFLDADS
ncbi:RPAP3-C domain-containing protein [Aphelenchoides fujianensis]|nr:RPAP3-C domain-containing protein [Aphelenchoides fujianensis]